jgi:uncharacterized protein (TIGR02145 family)
MISKHKFQIASITAMLILLVCVSCEDDKITPEPENETGVVVDIENHSYKTVKIGDAWWMAENLKVTTYRNGNPINQSQSTSSWNTGLEAYCLYDDNQSAPGLLYNKAAVSSPNGLAPEGWHVATEQDWQNLERELGMSNENIDKLNWRDEGSCGEKLKIQAPAGWSRFGTLWPSNSSGFTALAGGCRLGNGTWSNPGLFSTGFWWSSSYLGNGFSNTSYFRQLDYKKAGIFRFYVDKNYGMSVRCVKD